MSMDGQGTKWANGEKKLPKISTRWAWVACTNLADRQTTDRRNGDSIANVNVINTTEKNKKTAKTGKAELVKIFRPLYLM